MRYDFTTPVNRRNTGSEKWEHMLEKNPNLPEDIYPFTVADMDLKMAPELVEGLKCAVENLVMGYSCARPSYLNAVCGWMKRRHGWETKPEWICSTQGVIDGILMAVEAFSKPGDGIIIMTPVYPPFYMAAGEKGRHVVENPLIPEGDSYKIDFDGLERLAQNPENTLLILCSPHNPVGRVWTRQELSRIADICLENQVKVVSDEIHSDLILPGNTHTVFAQISKEAAENCVVCTAPSKTFNLAGMRASNLFIPGEDMRKRFVEVMQENHAGGLNTLGYEACEIAYRDCEGWLEELLILLEKNYRTVKGFLEEKIPQVKITKMEGTYLAWLDFRGLFEDAGEREEFLQNKAFLFLNPGSMFGAAGEGFDRMNLACPTSVVLTALERLYDALKEDNRI